MDDRAESRRARKLSQQLAPSQISANCDVGAYPNLIEGLLRRGYTEADIRKILGENLLRVWSAVENYAATTSTST